MKKLIVKIKNNEEVLISLDGELESVSFGTLDRGDVSNVTDWGSFSNKGEVVFFDNNDLFNKIVSENPDLDICIYYKDNFINKKVATFKIDDYNFYKETKKVVISFKDNLIEYQEKIFNKIYEFEEKTAGYIVNNFLSQFVDMNEFASILLSGINFNIPYIEEGTVWDAINKICQATMTRCFCNEDGKPSIYSDKPQQNRIIIKPKNILSIQNEVSKRKTVIKPSIKAKDYIKMENKKVAESVKFNWFRLTDYSNNTIFTEIYTGENSSFKIGSNIAKAKAVLNLYDNFHSFSETSDITVKKYSLSKTFDGGVELIKEQLKTTEPNMFGNTYEPTSIEKSDVSNGKVEITLTEENAVDWFSGTTAGGQVGKYVITDGTINWLGNYFIDNGEVSYGEIEENNLLQTNELIQKNSNIAGNEFGEFIPLGKYIVEKVKEQYGDGIECVVLDVTPSEYYDQKNDRYVSYFSRYDIVIPYVLSNGIEVPYRTKEDGTPLEFKVIGIEYYYKGFLRQRLHLQENKY